MKPEEKAEIILWDWLITKSKFVEEVFFNRKNKLNAPVFTTKGINKKPDFIIKINNGYEIKYYAIEVKSADNSKNIIQSSKIIDLYLKNYNSNKTRYFIKEKKIKLNGFLIASDKSKFGHLFKEESWIDNTSKDAGLSKFQVATKYKIIPKKEGSRTFEFIRILWDNYAKIRENTKLDVGIIIGNFEDNFSPYIMITNFYYKKERWSQRWWKI